MGCNTHRSKTQYIHAKSDPSSWMSFSTHNHRATQPHSSMNIHQLQMSCNTYPFSAIFTSNFEIHPLELAALQRCNLSSFDQNHHLKWTVIHIIHSATKTERRQISSSRLSRTTLHSRMSILPRSSSALLRVRYGRPHSSAIYLKTPGIVLKFLDVLLASSQVFIQPVLTIHGRLQWAAHKLTLAIFNNYNGRKLVLLVLKYLSYVTRETVTTSSVALT